MPKSLGSVINKQANGTVEPVAGCHICGKMLFKFLLLGRHLHIQLCISLTIQLFTQIFQLYLQIQRNLDSYSITSKSCFIAKKLPEIIPYSQLSLKLLIVDLIMSHYFLLEIFVTKDTSIFSKLWGIVTQTDLNYQIEPLYVLKENFKQKTLAVKRGV